MSEMEQYNILIVDEDEATRCTLADLLRGRDEYRVLVAGEGREAVKMFVEEARVDIVLTDIHMPGFNCLELMSDMQRLKHRPEILVMTSNGSPEVVEQARRIGARSIILKPFEHLDLIEAEVEKAVEALFEARASSSCRMMAPPSATRGGEAKAVAPPAVEAKPSPAKTPEENPFVGNETPGAGTGIAAATAPATPARPSAAPRVPAIPTPAGEARDAGLTMRIDRPDFAVAAPPPESQPEPPVAASGESAKPEARPEPATEPARVQPAAPVAPRGERARPDTVSTPAPAAEQSGAARQSSAADKSRGRVGLPNLGALKSKLFGKGADLKVPNLSGDHPAGGIPDLVPARESKAASPAASPIAPSAVSASTPPAASPAAPPAASPSPPSTASPTAPPATSSIAPPAASPSAPSAARPNESAAATTSPAPVAPTIPNAPGAPAETSTPPPSSEEVPNKRADQGVAPGTPAVPEVEKSAGTKPIPSPMEIVDAAPASAEPVKDPTDPDMFVLDLDDEESTAAAAATPAEEAKGPEPFTIEQEDADRAVASSAAPVAETPPAILDNSGMSVNGAEQPPDLSEQAMAADETGPADQNDDGSSAVPAELEAILAAGTDVDIEKMKVQIPIICLQTWEENAALEALRPMAGRMKRAFYSWSATRGIVKEDGTVMGEMYCDPIQALEFIRRQKTNGLFVLIDFHSCLEDRKVVRLLREMFDAGETGRGLLVITAPAFSMPPELQPASQVFDWPRGGAIDFDKMLEEVRAELSGSGGDAIDLDPEARKLLIERVQGMPAGRVRFEFLCALRGRGQSAA